jgi:hypothetical protein
MKRRSAGLGHSCRTVCIALASDDVFDGEDVLALHAPRFVVGTSAMGILSIGTNRVATFTGLRRDEPTAPLRVILEVAAISNPLCWR